MDFTASIFDIRPEESSTTKAQSTNINLGLAYYLVDNFALGIDWHQDDPKEKFEGVTEESSPVTSDQWLFTTSHLKTILT